MTAQPEQPVPPLARATLDRSADERAEEGLLDRLRTDPATRVLVVRGDTAPVLPGEVPSLQLVEPHRVPEGAQWAFLGRDEGRAILCAAFPADAAVPFATAGAWSGLRAIGGGLAERDAGLFVEALSLGRWLIEAPHCPACGTLADVRMAGWSRVCPRCGREHFPRTDPAVIVAVESGDGERLLLGSNALWDQDRYSCFAGFVEAGESLEAAVAREVQEESGIRVARVTYRGSQAWPYPRSLMLGFRARALRDEDARADGEEIAHVRWFTRSQLREAFAGDADVTLPGTASIAHALIREWADET
jgi:NAD+ diphosphatase